MLRLWFLLWLPHPMSIDSGVTHTGLTAAEVTARRAQFGDNTLPEEVTESVARKLLGQFQNPLIYILLFALLVDSALWWYDGADTLPVESLAILLILLTNAIPGEPPTTFDTSLFIVASVVVVLAGGVVLTATKGKLGFNGGLEPFQNQTRIRSLDY